MSLHFDCFCFYTPDSIPYAVKLLARIGVDGCGCPMSSKVRQIGTACRAFIRRPSTSDSVANDITFLMIFAST